MKSKQRSPLHFKALHIAVRFIAIGWLCFSAAAAQANSLWVVVHPNNPVSSITAEDLTSIYLGMQTFFPSGEKITPLDLSSEKTAFYETVLNKQMSQINKYWTKAIFSGKGTPPKEFTDIRSLLAYTFEKPGFIAYLPAGTDIGKLKILRIEP